MKTGMIGMSTVQFGLRLLLAITMAGAVGLERQWRQRMAGTRTNALVAAGAAAFVISIEDDVSTLSWSIVESTIE